jgi:ribosomal protein S27AE
LATDSPQRAYRAACPGCGAPVEFRSAQSTTAVCGYCQSTVVRQGDTLQRIGKMAELFEDFSVLQLGAAGVWQQKPFMLVGRLQYKYREGTWTEWHALFNDGSLGFLSEDNGAFVFGTPLPERRDTPTPEHFQVGGSTNINGKAFSVGSTEQVSLISAQGELPRLPALGVSFAMVELRSADGQVLSIDYGSQPPTLSIGGSVELDSLQLTGLKDESAKDEKGRQFACPNCGASVAVSLMSTKSLTCGSCNAIIDVSQGIGGELKAATQTEPVTPLIPLGAQGQLQGVQWQVVGFQHRMGTDPSDPDEHFGWSEYLLYNKKRGFSFLVDSVDGWCLVKPTTGAPVMTGNGQSASYLGTTYRLKETYRAETGYVLGEFYWQVQRGQVTQNRDFTSGANLLSLEQSANEVVWSAGSRIDSNLVAKAFKLDAQANLFKRGDAGPLSVGKGMGCGAIIIMLVVILILLALVSQCSSCDPARENCSSSAAPRSSGGSYGGSSGGGGHK